LSQQAQRKLDLAVVGTTRAEVSIHVLKRFRIPVPGIEAQHRIVIGMRRLDDEIRSEELAFEKMQTVRLGLARDLLSGRVRVAREAL
jgi:type I restriction enzyme S subunit